MRRFCVGLLVVILLPAVPCTSNAQQPVPVPSVDDLESAVVEHLEEARRAFDDVASRRARGDALAVAYGDLGRVYHAYEMFDAAEAAYASAVRLAPRDWRWPYLLGYLYQQTGRLEEAVDALLAAQRANPDDRAIGVRLGDVYLGLNRLGDARGQFEQAVAAFPAVARHGLGQVALRERRFDAAIAHFRFVLERVPDATAIHYLLAMAYRGLGRLDEARFHLRQRGSGGLRAADAIVDELQMLVRGERALVIQGSRAFEAGQFAQAAETFRKAVDAVPGSAAARANLGLALVRLGKDREAIDHLRAAFEETPEAATVRRELVGALLRLGRSEDVIDVLTRARLVDPDDEDLLVSLSILLADRARYREAVALLDDANRRFPDRTATATTLARLLAASPDRSIRDARRALEMAMAVYAVNPSPTHAETIAMALAESDRCAEALAWLRRALMQADQAGDETSRARLEGEMPKYQGGSCRPEGR